MGIVFFFFFSDKFCPYLSIPIAASKIQNCSLKYKGAKLFNLLESNKKDDNNFALNQNQLSNLVHR